MAPVTLSLVILPKQGIDIIQTQRPNVCELFNLSGNGLGVVIGQIEVELLDAVLNSVPTSKTMTNADVTCHTEVFRFEDLVGGGIVEDGLGMDAGFMGEGAIARDVVVEGNLHVHGLGNEVLHIADRVQVILVHHVIFITNVHARQEATQGGDAVALANAQN
ncbi:hypothetical protein BC938DRAFT_482861 [Jimgerdemannia flammicorona]|uniref:Uncharacterized protein n=1 Tax=Jimgerdemannia flammicorona TaxID=994334 RepID=A0A433QD80_9FUNG|nr:hypothetical protein BC938DRAFT_482861 [Jimgerdemannia flammicorona]